MKPVYVWNCFFSHFCQIRSLFFCDHPYPFNEHAIMQIFPSLGKKTRSFTRGETIRVCATKKTGLPTVIWLVAKKLNFEFQKFKNDDFFSFSFNIWSVLHFSYVIDKIFSVFMSKLNFLMQQFQLKKCDFTGVQLIFQNSNETDISFRPVSLKLPWN